MARSVRDDDPGLVRTPDPTDPNQDNRSARGHLADVSRIGDARWKRSGHVPTSSGTLARFFADHPVWTVLGAFVLMTGLLITVLLANIDTVKDQVGALHTDIRELRDDVDDVKRDVGEINSEIGYIKGRLDQQRDDRPPRPPPSDS